MKPYKNYDCAPQKTRCELVDELRIANRRIRKLRETLRKVIVICREASQVTELTCNKLRQTGGLDDAKQ